MIKVIIAVDENQRTVQTDFKDMTILELAEELGIQKHSIGAVLVDGVPKKLHEKTNDNTEIYVLPVLSGG
jgi:sulfur carrier protein ThiS